MALLPVSVATSLDKGSFLPPWVLILGRQAQPDRLAVVATGRRPGRGEPPSPGSALPAPSDPRAESAPPHLLQPRARALPAWRGTGRAGTHRGGGAEATSLSGG